jgi:putative membrane protein
MISVSDLPTLNASLNGTSAVLLMVGYFFIRRKRIVFHKICMLGAFATSALFLISYVVYHYHVGSKPFAGQGWTRPLYFTILISHVLLATAIMPMSLITLGRAWREEFDRHRRIARWTLPLWLYVSISGVIVYLMLYGIRY